MHRNGQHEWASHTGNDPFKNPRPLASFYDKILVIVSYATACAIVALAMAYWSVPAGNIPTKLNVLPAHLSSVSDVSNRIHERDRLSGLSFEERWERGPDAIDCNWWR